MQVTVEMPYDQFTLDAILSNYNLSNRPQNDLRTNQFINLLCNKLSNEIVKCMKNQIAVTDKKYWNKYNYVKEMSGY